LALQDVFFAVYPYTFLRTKPKVKVVNWEGGGRVEVDKVEMGAFNFLVLNLKSYISLFSQIFSRKKMPNGAKKGVSMYMGMNNLLFICFLWWFFF
jgi:hypothetical protein